jgi:hypothetical protein
MARIARYCACGSTLTGRVSPDSAAAAMEAGFASAHDGEGHAPATQAQAANARRRYERAWRASLRT